MGSWLAGPLANIVDRLGTRWATNTGLDAFVGLGDHGLLAGLDIVAWITVHDTRAVFTNVDMGRGVATVDNIITLVEVCLGFCAFIFCLKGQSHSMSNPRLRNTIP